MEKTEQEAISSAKKDGEEAKSSKKQQELVEKI